MTGRLVTVFGGSGFLGRYIVEKLAAQGDRVRVAVRRPNNALFLKPMGELGQVQPVAANLRYPQSIARAVEGADLVINVVGILYEGGKQTFQAIHCDGAEAVAMAARSAGVQRLVHISAIGADINSPSKYAASKGAGEKAVLQAFPDATILRPSLVIGPEDDFFNRFAPMLKLLPILPLPGAECKFQPVYVGDVAEAVAFAADNADTKGRIYELGGPEVRSFKELLEILMRHMGIRRKIVDMPMWIAKCEAAVLGMMPNPVLTLDQLKLLKRDNIVAPDMPGFSELGISPRPIESVLPLYTVQYRSRGQFS